MVAGFSLWSNLLNVSIQSCNCFIEESFPEDAVPHRRVLILSSNLKLEFWPRKLNFQSFELKVSNRNCCLEDFVILRLTRVSFAIFQLFDFRLKDSLSRESFKFPAIKHVIKRPMPLARLLINGKRRI